MDELQQAVEYVEMAFPDATAGNAVSLGDGSVLVWEAGGEGFFIVEPIDERTASNDEFVHKNCTSAKLVCTACEGRGYLLADNDVHGLRIERCDAAAVEFVFNAAKGGTSRLTKRASHYRDSCRFAYQS